MQRRLVASGAVGAMVAVLTMSPIRAADLFVNNTAGHDTLNGSIPHRMDRRNGPLRTLGEALRRVSPGQRIIVVPTEEPYREEVVISGSRVQGARRSPVVIEGNGVEWLGTAPVDPAEFRYLGNDYYQSGGPARTGGLLEIGARLTAPERKSLSWPRPELQPDRYALWRGTILFRVEPGRKIESYRLAETKAPCGLLIHRASYVVVRNVRFRGFRYDAVQVRGPARGVRFENCLFAGCGRAGVTAATNVELALAGCHLENNLLAGAVGSNYSDVRLASCRIAGSRDALVHDASSVLEANGAEPAPLEPGPFVLPAEARQVRRAPSASARLQPTAKATTDGKVKSFFHE